MFTDVRHNGTASFEDVTHSTLHSCYRRLPVSFSFPLWFPNLQSQTWKSRSSPQRSMLTDVRFSFFNEDKLALILLFIWRCFHLMVHGTCYMLQINASRMAEPPCSAPYSIGLPQTFQPHAGPNWPQS